MKNKNVIIAVLTTILVGFFILVVVGYTSKEEPVSTIDYAREGYMGGCMGEDASWELCNCSYNVLIKEYGKSGLVKMADNVPQEAIDLVVDKCM